MNKTPISVIVDVHCPADPFYMVVCYTPRQQGDMVFVDGRANNVECRGFPVIQTGQCQAGQVQVSLPLATARLGTCGTMEISGDVSNLAHEIWTLLPEAVISSRDM